MYVVKGREMDKVGLAVAVEVAALPGAETHAVAGPGTEKSDGEAAISVGDPRMNVVEGRELDKVGLAVAVEVAALPGTEAHAVAGPRAEEADGEAAVPIG